MRITTIFLLCFLINSLPVISSERIALVIGNGQYDIENGSLVNASHDARAVAKALTSLGFDVDLKINLSDQEAMETAVDKFSEKLTDKTIGLFYYAGHAIQYNNINYLIPTQENISNARQIKHRALDVTYLLDQMNAYRPKTAVVILDSCRDNPFPKALRSTVGRGLGRVSPPGDMLIVYSTKAGATADDGDNLHSPYTETLLNYLQNFPHLPLSTFFNQVAVAVETKTQYTQSPRLYSAPLHYQVCFSDCGIQDLNASTKPDRVGLELEMSSYRMVVMALVGLLLMVLIYLWVRKPLVLISDTGLNHRPVMPNLNWFYGFIGIILLITAAYYLKIISPIQGVEPKRPVKSLIEDSSQPLQQLKHEVREEGFKLALKEYQQGHYYSARQSLTKASEQGHLYATAMLAKLYAWGDKGLEQDLQKAIFLRDKVFRVLEQRAESGQTEAQFYLGGLYEAVDQDETQAMVWYQEAAQQNHAGAQNNLGILLQSGRGAKVNNIQAVYWFRLAAEAGHLFGQYNLGKHYFDGLGIAQDDKQAYLWLSRSAQQGYAPAQAFLGYLYKAGRGVVQDDIKAVHWYRKSALQNNPYAQNNLGLMYEQGRGVQQNFSTARDWYTKAAVQQNAQAQNHLGMMYHHGHGVLKDLEKAFFWYKKAAEQGEPLAEHNLAWLYEQGKGIAQNDRKALFWYAKAAQQGLAEAQTNLAWMYAQGRGAKRNYQKSVHWYRLAATKDSPRAQNNLGRLYQQGLGLQKNQHQAFLWYQKAADQGYAEAQVNLGWLYEHGVGMHKDIKQAAHWYLQAAEQGSSQGQNNLAGIYKQGQGVIQSDLKAVNWYRLAAQQGNADAQVGLGWMYEYGRGVDKNNQQARYWYRKAADAGHAQGQNNLGWLYKYGSGVKASDRRAFIWFRKAAEQGNAAGQNNLAVMYELGRGVKRNHKSALFWYRKAAQQGDINAKNNLANLGTFMK